MRNLWIGIVMVVAACGSSSVGINELSDKYVSAFCTSLVGCKEAADVATCKASFVFDLSEPKAEIAAGHVAYDADAAGDCVDEAASRGCAFTGFRSAANDPCDRMFTGKVATGGACFDSGECAAHAQCMQTDQMCDSSSTCCPGTCQTAPVKGAVGATCTGATSCADNLYCSGKTQTCAAVATTVGAACEGLDGCANPLLCNLDFMTSTGTCMKPAGAGEACDPSALLPCARFDQYCSDTSRICVASVAVGGSCAQGESCLEYAYCDQTSHTCKAFPNLGEACTDTVGCAGDLECQGTCMAGTSLVCE